MKKASLIAGAAVLSTAALAGTAFAQDGPFKDVPNDHWAYQGIEKVAAAKIFIGDPDGMFRGKRNLTRYEMAVIVARMLDYIDGIYAKKGQVGGGTVSIDTSNFATKGDLSGKADKSDLANLVTKDELNTLRRMVAEFQTELTTLGVDLDAVKKRLDSLEGRVTKVEDTLKKMIKVTGAFNANVRGNFRTGKGTTGIIDRDGYLVTGGAGSRGGVLQDTRVLHDLDLNFEANPAEGTKFEATVNFGNYLNYLGSIANYANVSRTNRGGLYSGQMQDQTIYKAILHTGVSLPVLGNTHVDVGRIPLQFTPYTFKGIDVDSYFRNVKTDEGNIPVDGALAQNKFGPIHVTTVAAKVDPIKNVSNIWGQTDGTFYSVNAGAATGAYAGRFTTRGNVLQSPIAPGRNGSMLIEQMAGLQAKFKLGPFHVGGTGIAFSGTENGNAAVNSNFNLENVSVYGGTVDFNLGSLKINSEYSKVDTLGTTLNTSGGINTKVKKKIKNNNDAYDVAGHIKFGKLSLLGGYRYVGPYFAAPGNWARLGTFQNPIDIQGGYGKVSLEAGKAVLSAGAQSYQGTGKATGDNGLTKNDKVNNIYGSLKLAVTQASNLYVSGEVTEYKTPQLSAKPRETFVNIGYSYSFNPATSFRLMYQTVEFDNKGTSFDPMGNSKGGIIASQFTVKF